MLRSVLLLSMTLAGCGSPPAAPPPTRASEPRAGLSAGLSAGELLAGAEALAGQVVAVRGVVMEVGTDLDGSAYLVLGSTQGVPQVILHARPGEVLAVAPGRVAHVVGFCRGCRGLAGRRVAYLDGGWVAFAPEGRAKP